MLEKSPILVIGSLLEKKAYFSKRHDNSGPRVHTPFIHAQTLHTEHGAGEARGGECRRFG